MTFESRAVSGQHRIPLMKAPARAYLRVVAVFLLLCLPAAAAEEPSGEPLAGTSRLTAEGDLSAAMIAGIDRWLLRKIADTPAQRARFWNRDQSTPEAYARSVEPNRERLRRILGVVDSRIPFTGLLLDEPLSGLTAQGSSGGITVHAVRWPVLEGVWGRGLVLRPSSSIRGRVIALGDADQTPEMLAGLAAGIEEPSQFAKHLAEHGFEVVIPLLIDRSDEGSGNPSLGKYTNQPHREWVYRQAFHMGRHVIGYEIQEVLALVDLFSSETSGTGVPLGIAGYGEGGLIAFASAALDPRLQSCLVSGYFAPRESLWEEPIYRNVFGLLREFGDAEMATLIAPRPLIVEHASFPHVSGPPAATKERRGAAVGRIVTPEFGAVQAEFSRIDTLVKPGFQKRTLVRVPDESSSFGTVDALDAFMDALGAEAPVAAGNAMRLIPAAITANPQARQLAQVKELEGHVQRLVNDSDRVRDAFFLRSTKPIQEIEKSRNFRMARMEPRPVAGFTSETANFREQLWRDVFGKLEDPIVPANPRTRLLYDQPKWRGYEVMLDVYPDVYAWGLLLLPKDLQPGEKRPVVVCQHGRGSLPKDTVVGDDGYYHNYAARLADRGYIVFAPHNFYRGEDAYRLVQRKANSIGASMFSIIIAQHQRILEWLGTLPNVDPKRIALYGLSYGGETAIRVPAVLDQYCLSICSGDFNDWTRKVASTGSPYSFMFTEEWEMPYFNMGNTFSYAEMAYLIFPRPFMVERGHHDTVAPDSWVASEYAKVRYLYAQFAQEDRTEIEFYNGGHTIHGQGTFEFLQKHLQWPP
jgi:dienelactone hydrolase